MHSRLKLLPSPTWFRALFFAAVYFGAARLSASISFSTASFPTLWLPAGLLLAVLLRSPQRHWPVYLLSAFLGDLAFHWSGQPLGTALLSSISTLLGGLTSAWLINRFQRQREYFYAPGYVFSLIAFSCGIGGVLSATLDTAILAALTGEGFSWPAWRIAWISQILGVLATTPLLLTWAAHTYRSDFRFDREHLIELVILMTGLMVCALFIFVGTGPLSWMNYIIAPFLVWAALRFGPRGASLSGLVVTLVSVWGTTQQLGQFVYNDQNIVPTMDTLGSFLGVTLITSYILAAVWAQGRRAEQALRDSEERYRLLVDNQGEGIGLLTPSRVFTLANPAAANIFGVAHGSLIGRSLDEFLESRDRSGSGRLPQDLSRPFEIQICQTSGNRRSLLVTPTPRYDEDGEFTGTFAVFRDITERTQAEVALRDSRARFQTLFNHSPISIWEEDFSRIRLLTEGLRRDGVEDFREYFTEHPEQCAACEKMVRVIDVNQATLELFGYSDKAVFLAQIPQMMSRGPVDIFLEELVAIAEGRTEFEMEGPNDLVDGQVRYHYVRWTVAPGYERDYRRVILTVADVTERRNTEERMRYLSTHDLLTGLYNRNFFEAELERLQNSRLEPINVMVVDVNDMKATNDTYGHAQGDDLLRRTAQVLKLSFRKEDIVARIGGDEFVVLFHGVVPIQDAVDRVKECLIEHNHWYEGPPLSLAIGAVSGNKGSQLEELVKRADQMMYKEKLQARRSRPENKN